MKPSVEQTLSACAAELVDVGPLVQPSYRGAVVSYIAHLLTAASEAWDGAAHHLVEENRALRALFAAIRPVIGPVTGPLTGDTALLSAVDAHIAGSDDDLRISSLTAANDAMRATLIDLHAAVEEVDGPAAREAEQAIWRELRRSTERRHLSTDMYY